MAELQKLIDRVDSYRDEILAAERYIWKNPEAGYKEWKTHRYMKQKFEELGYTVVEAGDIPGFYADLDTGRPGPKLAIFGELDSLIIDTHPECDPETKAVHACGHNCQCAALLGVAAGLKTPGALDGLSGSIRLIAVPAEELIDFDFRKGLIDAGTIHFYGGKQEFMYRGYLDDVDLSFMIHTKGVAGPTVGMGAGSNGCILKNYTFIGKSSHAGGSPHLGLNALYAASTALSAANALRETFREKDYIRFHPIITQGGAAVNAIPDKVMVQAYVRGASMAAIAEASNKINRAFAAAAASVGCKLEINDVHGYAPRFYGKDFANIFKDAALKLLPEEEVALTDSWAGGCSDMGDVACIMPAIHPHIAGYSGTAHGSDLYITDPERGCVLSAKIQLSMALDLLENGAEKAKAVVADYKPVYASAKEYTEAIDKLNFTASAVQYEEDGSIKITYKA